MEPSTPKGSKNAGASGSLFGSVRKRVLELSQASSPGRALERQFWMPDSRAKQCLDCGTTFTTFKRRHHCRICGQVFCHACSFQMIDAKLYKVLTGNDSSGPVRSCRYCYKASLRSDPGTFGASNSNSSASGSNTSVASSSVIRNDVARERHQLESNAGSGAQGASRRRGSEFGHVEGSVTPTRLRRDSSSWLGFGSNLARRFSSTASLGSFANPHSTPFPDHKFRPQSSNSDRFTVLDIDETNNGFHNMGDGMTLRTGSGSGTASGMNHTFHGRRSRHNTGELQNSSSFDNLYSLMNKRMDSKFDENKPKWVKELLEQSKFEEDKMAFQEEAGSRDGDLKREGEFEIEEEPENVSFRNSREDLNTSKASSENILEIKSSEDCVVKFRKKSQSPHESRKMKLKQILGETIDSREFEQSGYGDQLEVDFFARETMKQYFAREYQTPETQNASANKQDSHVPPSPSLPVLSSDFSDSESVPGMSLPESLSEEEVKLKLMSLVYDRHMRTALKQKLLEQELTLEWLPVIHDIASRLANSITLGYYSYVSNIDNYFFGTPIQEEPLISRLMKGRSAANVRKISNDIGLKYFSGMDIRQRVKIKCIEGDHSKSESTIIQGLVFTRNVANKRMRNRIENARIMIFGCSIGFDERKRSSDNGKMTCMDMMRLQEASYCENLSTRIGALKPDVIFVQGSVSGSILERLQEFFNITVVLNVKKNILERLGFITGATPIISPELLNSTKVGVCSCFQVLQCNVSYGKLKSLMIVETDIQSRGYSVLLKGTNITEEFDKVKAILLDVILWHYNARLEQAMNSAMNCLPFSVKNCDNNQPWNSLTEIYQHFQKLPQPSGKNCIQDAEYSKTDGSLLEESCLSKVISVEDDSDPLRAQEYDTKENGSDIKVSQEMNLIISDLSNTISSKFQQILNETVLSVSPNVQFPLPFLVESDIYFRSCSRPYFTLNVIKSQKLSEALVQDYSGEVFSENPSSSGRKNTKEEDLDYKNFNYLAKITAEKCAKYPQYKEAIIARSQFKMSILRATLRQRYMIQKPHPLLYGEGVPLWKMERFSAPDFRACGPYLRCIPDIVPTNYSRNGDDEQNCEKSFPDPLCLNEHQEISVLFSMFSPKSKNAPNYCFKPRIIDIEYYGMNDMSLGGFLFRHFFFMKTRQNVDPAANSAQNGDYSELYRKTICPNDSCFESLHRHVMRFAHHRGTLTILMNRVQESQNQQSLSKRILTWFYCKECQKRSKISELSQDAMAFSFGKFLELKFYSKDAINLARFELENDNCQCEISVRREAYQFFNFDHSVVSIKYDPIVLYEIATPPPVPHPFECSSNELNNSTALSNASGEGNQSEIEKVQLPADDELTVLVRDKDLGSIIAYAMRTQEYEQKLAKIQDDGCSVDGGVASKSIEEPTEEINPHIGIDFQDGNAKFYCFIYFAAEFARLRSALVAAGGWSHRGSVRNVFAGFSPSNQQIKTPLTTASTTKDSSSSSTTQTTETQNKSKEGYNDDAEELYIHSLANCIPWKAVGGKSGSTFSKTTNQRFILKEISKGELKHFVTFARDYVKYCEDCLNSKRPSTFVKIVGCYELAVSDSIHNILVMENLFYGCNISFIYDLKGSMRNRKVEIVSNSSGDKDSDENDEKESSVPAPEQFVQTTTVLMDENLRQISTLYPLYVHVHSKRLLLEALTTDSDFLKSKGVMDYSLLVGFDEQYSEYVVGIIDYVRLYDFTKELEFRVKKLGKTIDPTIVRPSSYQKRFLEAIQEYFIEVPEKWLKQMTCPTIRETDSEDSTVCTTSKSLPNDDDIVSFATFRQIDP